MGKTKIEWADRSWNPVTGCDKVSPGCKNCYAERMAHRLQRMGQPKYIAGFQVMTHHDCLREPFEWAKPSRVFVCSMGDLFHEEVPFEFIDIAFAVMGARPIHHFLVLTKRPERMLEYARWRSLPWPKNVHAGVTIESNKYVYRADLLREVPAQVRFISAEPLLGSLSKLDLTDIDQVIAGGEAGPGARGMDAEWVWDLRDRCVENDTLFFFKQWGGPNKKKAGRMLDGRTWDELPEGPRLLELGELVR